MFECCLFLMMQELSFFIIHDLSGTGGIAVDLVAGTRDGVIPPHNIRIHYEAMRAAGLEVRSFVCYS